MTAVVDAPDVADVVITKEFAKYLADSDVSVLDNGKDSRRLSSLFRLVVVVALLRVAYRGRMSLH
jgi:hypothetical protein